MSELYYWFVLNHAGFIINIMPEKPPAIVIISLKLTFSSIMKNASTGVKKTYSLESETD